MRVFVAVIALLGLAVFGSAFVVSYANPVFAESLARDGVRWQVERHVGESIDALDGGQLARAAARVSGRNSAEIEVLKRQLREGLPEKVARIAAEMRTPDCSCRHAIATSLTGFLVNRIDTLAIANEQLELLIRTKYMEAAHALTREFRIFTGANAVVFLLLLLVTALRPRAGLQLVLPAMVLLGAAGVVGYLYLFEQDWLNTIVFAEYVGLGYFAYLALAIALLADVAFNRARVSTRVVNVALDALGAGIQAVPC
jgi:hypothetical protein